MFEVDRVVLRERTTHPLPLRLSRGEDASDRLTQIAEENARFNIGDVVRTVNEPTFPLTFLRPRNRERIRFVPLGDEKVGDLLTWVVGYVETPVDGRSFIGTDDGDNLLTRGRFWIDPTNGRVVRSELIIGDARVGRTGRLTVYYRWFPTVNLWLPAQMHEVYEATDTARHSTIITGTATDSNYRVLPATVASLTVAWDPSLDSSVVGYIVEWGETSGVYRHTTDVGNVTEFTVDALPEGQRCFLVVRAYTSAGTRSIRSNETSRVAVTSAGVQRQ